MGKLLTRDQVLAASDVETEEVEVPEWGEKGDTVLVKGLDALYVSKLLQSGFIETKPDGSQEADISKLDFIDLAARSLVDENGERLLTRAEAKRMGEKSFAVIARIATRSLALSGLTEEEAEEETEFPNG